MQIDASILDRSRATERFKQELRRYADRHDDVTGIAITHRVPRVKVLRLIHHLLEVRPELPIERLTVDARSGCSDFVGSVTVEADGIEHTFEFVWDCRWRAEQEGWVDCFGFPDQMRAADEFGWRCFAHWQERSVRSMVGAG